MVLELWLCVVCLVVWVGMGLLHGFFWAFRVRLRKAGGPVLDWPPVTVVIPARDEAESIGRAVESLRRQAYGGPLRIVVADDESSDGTGRLAIAAGADTVVRVPPRPAGWKGKLWAVSRALAEVPSSNWFVLFTDADIEHVSPELVAALVARAGTGYDMVSVMVQLRCESFAEKMLVPAFVFFFFMLYPPSYVKRGWATAAAGGCMLMRREMVQKIGGVDGIKDALIDDCALARKVRGAGGRIWLGVSELETRSIREYGTAAEIRAMISRSAFEQLRHSWVLLAASVLGMLFVFVMPAVLAICGDGMAQLIAAATWAVSALLFLPSVRWHKAPAWTAACLPLIALFYLWATVESAVAYWSGRGGTWKGRVQDERV